MPARPQRFASRAPDCRDAELEARIGALDPFGKGLRRLMWLQRSLAAVPGREPGRRQYRLADIADQPRELVEEGLQCRRRVEVGKVKGIGRDEEPARKPVGD